MFGNQGSAGFHDDPWATEESEETRGLGVSDIRQQQTRVMDGNGVNKISINEHMNREWIVLSIVSMIYMTVCWSNARKSTEV